MNFKAGIGFLAGVLVASGVAYVITHREAPAPAAIPTTVPAVASNPVQQPLTASSPPPAEQPKPAPTVKPKVIKKKPIPARPTQPEEVQETAEAIPPAPTVAPEAPSPAAAPPPSPVAPAPAPAVTTPVRPPQPVAPPARVPNTVTIAPGTPLAVRLGEGLSSDRSRPDDEFTGVLDQPLVVDGFVIAERGARVEGRVIEAVQAGRVRGLAQLSLELTRLHTSDGQKVPIRTAAFVKEGQESKKEDAAKVGIGAALGAIIGAAAGGGKGAAIGAAAGGAAGGGAVAATRGKPAVLPVETVVNFRTAEPVTITERLN
jgi:hypothetical protein